MYRQSPSRNQRSKGIKCKHVLQICLLLAVCFWLIYQVKHSHDKKKEFDESDAKALLQRVSSGEFTKLGRKDIHHRAEGMVSKNEKHDEPAEEEETTGEEVEDIKHEEDEPEDKNVEGKDDEGMGGGDDEIDEHEKEKSDAEVDREEDLVDDERREGSDENETQETYSEDDHGQMEKESSAEDTDHDGDDRSTHEAREEHYKADDASSAVTHDTEIATTENENEHVEKPNEHPENILEEENKENNSEETNKGENRKDLEVEGGEMARDDHQSNVTTSETKIDMLDNSENGSSPNNTIMEGSNDHLATNSSPEVVTENHDLSSQDVTESEPELDRGQGILTEGTSIEGSDLQTIASEQANNSTSNVDSNRFDSNSAGSAETKDAESRTVEFSISSNNSTESSASENITRSEASVEAGNNTESSLEKNDKILESTATENPEEVQHDTIDISDTSNSMEEKDVRVDLDTLPEIQTEGTNSEDAAAE
ncbi:hypothetical protein Pfo_002521 [Paulownia fortunei]|nr:hypothetical protein Pfo_002521 [Paulownia fortunei]